MAWDPSELQVGILGEFAERAAFHVSKVEDGEFGLTAASQHKRWRHLPENRESYLASKRESMRRSRAA